MHALLSVAYLLFSLLGGALFHGLCMKHNWLAVLAHPIDGGWTWRNKRIFGDHKTWRGLVAMGLGAGPVFALQALVLHDASRFAALELFDFSSRPWFGFVLGSIAMLGELPNSFLKRRLGIAPGAAAAGARRAIFYFFDQVDLLLGAWLAVLACVPGVPRLSHVGVSIAVVLVVHQLVTLVGYELGMRPTKR